VETVLASKAGAKPVIRNALYAPALAPALVVIAVGMFHGALLPSLLLLPHTIVIVSVSILLTVIAVFLSGRRARVIAPLVLSGASIVRAWLLSAVVFVFVSVARFVALLCASVSVILRERGH